MFLHEFILWWLELHGPDHSTWSNNKLPFNIKRRWNDLRRSPSKKAAFWKCKFLKAAASPGLCLSCIINHILGTRVSLSPTAAARLCWIIDETVDTRTLCRNIAVSFSPTPVPHTLTSVVPPATMDCEGFVLLWVVLFKNTPGVFWCLCNEVPVGHPAHCWLENHDPAPANLSTVLVVSHTGD